MYVCFPYVYVPLACLMYTELRRGHKMPFKWSYRQLWASCECWEPKLGLLTKQQVLETTAPPSSLLLLGVTTQETNRDDHHWLQGRRKLCCLWSPLCIQLRLALLCQEGKSISVKCFCRQRVWCSQRVLANESIATVLRMPSVPTSAFDPLNQCVQCVPATYSIHSMPIWV